MSATITVVRYKDHSVLFTHYFHIFFRCVNVTFFTSVLVIQNSLRFCLRASNIALIIISLIVYRFTWFSNNLKNAFGLKRKKTKSFWTAQRSLMFIRDIHKDSLIDFSCQFENNRLFAVEYRGLTNWYVDTDCIGVTLYCAYTLNTSKAITDFWITQTVQLCSVKD